MERIQKDLPISWGRRIWTAHKSASDKSFPTGEEAQSLSGKLLPPPPPQLAPAGIFMRGEETGLRARRSTLTAAEDFISSIEASPVLSLSVQIHSVSAMQYDTPFQYCNLSVCTLSSRSEQPANRMITELQYVTE